MPDVVTDFSNAGGFKRVQNSMWRAFHALEVAQHGIDEAWEALENMKEHIDFELWRCESEEKLARAVATPTPPTSPPAVQPPPGNFGIPLCRLTIPVKPPSPRCHCPHCSNGMSLTWGITSIADMGRATEQPSLLAIEDSQPQDSKDIIRRCRDVPVPEPRRPCPKALLQSMLIRRHRRVIRLRRPGPKALLQSMLIRRHRRVICLSKNNF